MRGVDKVVNGELRPNVLDVGARCASHRVIAVMFIAIVASLFHVSGGMLWEIGLNYDGISGAMASKIHPATYLTVSTFVLFLLARRNPASLLATLICRHAGSLVLLLATSAVMLFVILDHRHGLAGLVDTFLLPALLIIMIAELGSPTMRRLETMLHVLIACNALLTLFEFVSGLQLFPFRFDGELLVDTRPNGLQDHPLVNAVVTGTYLTILLTGAGANLGRGLKVAMILLQLAALVASGGRTALVLVTVFLAWSMLRGTYGVLRGKRVSIPTAAACAIASPLVALGLIALNALGFFDAILERFGNDSGSAQARVQMFELFSNLPFHVVLMGPDVEMVDSIRRAEGLELGIENPIIRFVLYQGILATSALMIGFVLFMRELVRTLRAGYGLPLIFFLWTIMSFESLSSKGTLLAQFVILMTVMFRCPTHGRFERSTRSNSELERFPVAKGEGGSRCATGVRFNQAP
jgi:hypothetical protein